MSNPERGLRDITLRGSLRLRLLAGVSLVCVALIGTACGGGDADAPGAVEGSAPKSSETASNGADLEGVRAELERYMGVPEFEPPGPAFDAKKVAGKSVLNIPYTSEIPFNQVLSEAMGEVARQYGIDYKEYATQGVPTQWGAGLNQAISQRVDAVNFSTADPRLVAPQVAAADKAGVKLVSTQTFGPDQISMAPPGLAAITPFPWATVARLMADWTIADTDGTANVLVVKSGEVLSAKPMVAAIEDEFASRCGEGCKVTMLDVPVSKWASRIQPSVQSALAKDPELNYVIAFFDGMVQFVEPAIRAANRVGDVHVATFNGTPFALKMMQQSDIVRMNVGQNLSWTGWAAMDQIMRVLAGEEPVEEESIPLRIFTRDNVDEAGTPPTYDKGYGDEYVAGFKKLWGGQ
jgi:ribose transport system substrate-binding protein